jgi:SnoaL-like domain
MTSEQEIRRALDEVEIRNVIARIAMATDRGNLEEYASLFSEDAHLEMRVEAGKPQVVPPTKGRVAILAGSTKRRADGISGPGSNSAHALQTSAIIVSGDSAKALTYVVLYKNTQATPEPLAIKLYNDTFVRTAQGWKVASRYIDPA